jgi:integrase
LLPAPAFALGKLAGLKWSAIDLESGSLKVREHFTHGAWSDLKTPTAAGCIPLAREVVKQLRLHRLRPPGELVFPSRSGAPIDYHNWHARSWVPRLERTGITGTSHILRHFFVTALIQSGVNAKGAQTLAGHHSAAFTLDQYADAVPQQLEEAGEKVASVLLPASGSNSGCGCYGECANSCALPDG